MTAKWDSISARLAARSPEGRPLPLISGSEPDGVLREMIRQTIIHCPGRHQDGGCPFQLLKSLPPAACDNLVSTMSRDTILFLFATEHEVRVREWASTGKRP